MQNRLKNCKINQLELERQFIFSRFVCLIYDSNINAENEKNNKNMIENESVG